MSTLHTRGYRPEPGERAWPRPRYLELLRVGDDGTRGAWVNAWFGVRSGSPLDSSSADALDLARECLDARETPDPLFAAAHARQVIRLRNRVRGQQRAIGAALAGPLRDMVEQISAWGEVSPGLRNDLGGRAVSAAETGRRGRGVSDSVPVDRALMFDLPRQVPVIEASGDVFRSEGFGPLQGALDPPLKLDELVAIVEEPDASGVVNNRECGCSHDESLP